MEWLPEFCLTAEELEDFAPGTALAMFRKAARSVYQTDKYQSRGEFGELFLHIALRQVYGSIPAISKIYWKDAANNTVKGYDAVHVIEANGNLELWLGEVKFYSSAGQAIRDVVAEIEAHTKIDYMENEVAFIANKLDKTSPHYPRLQKLLHPNTSIDDVFDAACIPILITYDSSVLKAHSKTSQQYLDEVSAEVEGVRLRLENKLAALNLPVKVHLFVIPLNCKADLIKHMHDALKRLQ